MSDELPLGFTNEPSSRAERRAHQAEADAALVSALSQAARVVAEEEPAGPAPATWHRLTRARVQPASRTSRALVWGAVGAAACASVLTAIEVVRHVHPSSLTYDVHGGALGDSGQVEAGPQGTALSFSDGTEISLDAQARLAVRQAGPHGARLRLQSGAAHFRVMHLPHAAWAVEAGPYVVEVTGTEFDVRWSEREQTVEVKMRSGSVRVSGPLLTERVTLGKGQHLLARLGMGDVRIDDGRPSEPAVVPAPHALVAPLPGATNENATALASPGVAPPVQPSSALAPDTAARSVPMRAHPRRRLALAEPVSAPPPLAVTPPPLEVAPPVRRDSPSDNPSPSAGATPKWRTRNWSARVAAGDASAVVDDAQSVGLDAAMRQADAGDLAALADAARYAGRPDLAERAFSATRHRFPGSSRARAAAFLLGRMADDRGDSHAGLAWYRAYLTEAPSGPYAAEALGREMLIVQRLQGRDAAIPLANEYLGRFPNGTYLLQARALIDNR